LAFIVMINKPSIPSASFQVGRVVLANGLPVQAMPGYFLCQYSFTPFFIRCRVEKRYRVNGEMFHPPTIDLHFPNIERLPGCNRFLYELFRFFPRCRVKGFPGNIDCKGVLPGFLPRYGLYQWCGWFRPRCERGSLQAKQNGQRENLLHGVNVSCFSVERTANKQPPDRMGWAGQEWSYRRWVHFLCPVLRSDCSISQEIEYFSGMRCNFSMF